MLQRLAPDSAASAYVTDEWHLFDAAKVTIVDDELARLQLPFKLNSLELTRQVTAAFQAQFS